MTNTIYFDYKVIENPGVKPFLRGISNHQSLITGGNKKTNKKKTNKKKTNKKKTNKKKTNKINLKKYFKLLK